jgi:hypothetical protein
LSEWERIIKNLAKIFDVIIDIYVDDGESSCQIKSPESLDYFNSPITIMYHEIEKEAFFCKNVGFNITRSNRKVFKFYNSLMASHFEYNLKQKRGFLEKIKIPISVLKYMSSDETRSQRTVHAYENITANVIRVSFDYVHSIE